MKPGCLPIHVGARNSVSPVVLSLLLLVCAACLGSFRVYGAEPPLEELRTAQQIRQLTVEQAAHHYPVHIQGVLTFYDQRQFLRFVQDDTAGIYFYLADPSNSLALDSGQLVEIEGETNPGEYA